MSVAELFDSSRSVPNNNIAKLMYYLKFVDSSLEIKTPITHKLTDYEHYRSLNETDVIQLIGICEIHSPEMLQKRNEIVVEETTTRRQIKIMTTNMRGRYKHNGTIDVQKSDRSEQDFFHILEQNWDEFTYQYYYHPLEALNADVSEPQSKQRSQRQVKTGEKGHASGSSMKLADKRASQVSGKQKKTGNSGERERRATLKEDDMIQGRKSPLEDRLARQRHTDQLMQTLKFLENQLRLQVETVAKQEQMWKASMKCEAEQRQNIEGIAAELRGHMSDPLVQGGQPSHGYPDQWGQSSEERMEETSSGGCQLH